MQNELWNIFCFSVTIRFFTFHILLANCELRANLDKFETCVIRTLLSFPFFSIFFERFFTERRPPPPPSFSEECKTAKLKPLSKKDAKTGPKNYYPILSLPHSSFNINHPIFPPPHSSFKRLFMTKLKHFYRELTCSFTHHSGFKPHSQGLTHHTSVNNFCGNENNNALVFLDLQEVFNCLDHHILPE